MKSTKRKKPGLADLADQALQHHRTVEDLTTKALGIMRSRIVHAKRAGEALCKAKALVKQKEREWKLLKKKGEHEGEKPTWGAWVEANLVPQKLSHRTANVYMRIARNWKKVYQAYLTNPNLTIEEADRILREKADDAMPGGASSGQANGGRTEKDKLDFERDSRRSSLYEQCKKAIKTWPDELLYVLYGRAGDGGMEDFLKDIPARVGDLAAVFWKAHCRYERACAKLGDDDGASGLWEQYQLQILEAFAGRDDLTPWQKKRILREAKGVKLEDEDRRKRLLDHLSDGEETAGNGRKKAGRRRDDFLGYSFTSN